MKQNVSVHVAFRILAFILGVGSIASWYSGFQSGHHLAIQAGVATLGGATVAFCMAFWPKYSSHWTNRLLISGLAILLLGTTWLMVSAEKSYLSFPGALMFLSAGLALITLFLPKRYLG